MRPRRASVRVLAGLLALVCSAAHAVRADESELHLLDRPTSFTDVADAADGDDPFDMNVRVLFRRIQESAEVRRERPSATGRSESDPVGEYRLVRHELLLGLDIGLYHDLELTLDLPLVLSDDRRINPVDGNLLDNLEGLPAGSAPAPFVSPTRSGIDNLYVGLGWGALSQYRHEHSPTWVFRLRGRFSIGDVRVACGAAMTGCGMSDGTHALTFETQMSHRFRYAEPYGGAGVSVQFAGRAADAFASGGDLLGYRHTRPPLVAEFVAGMALIPWENRGKLQRLTLDFRLRGVWVGEGRSYSPLFDALGTSTNPALTAPNCEGVPTPGTTDCTGAPTGLQLVPFVGVTDVQAHGKIGGQIAVDLQAARFIRFGFGGSLLYTTPHLVTGTSRCNAQATPSSASDARIAGCSEGVVDPHHRVVLDTPGQRFSLDGQLRLSLFASVRAQF